MPTKANVTVASTVLSLFANAGRESRSCALCVGPVVLIVKVAVAVFPVTCAEEGDTTQVARAGAPLQVNATDPVNPYNAETVNVDVADAPAFRETVVLSAAREKSETLCVST